MERLPILYYRKLKSHPTVWVPAMQMKMTLEISDGEDVFLGVTQYAWDGSCCFGYTENRSYPADANTNERVELEVCEDKFADDKHYTKQEVDDILHPILYNEPICYNPFNNLK